MPKAAARRARSTAASKTLEHRILLTATMCLLAYGAVMVYSASSATTLLQGRGNGSGYLLKFIVYGGLGLVVMQLLARDGIEIGRASCRERVKVIVLGVVV